MADRTPTKRYSLETSVCRNCNGNIVLKKHPLDLFWKKVAKEGILRDLEKFCGFKITFEDCFPARNISLYRQCTEPVKVTKFQEFVKMAIHSRVQRDSALRSKRGKSLVDSPASSSSPSSGREKTKSKVSWFRDVYVLNTEA